MQESVAVRNARLDAIETAIGTAPKLRFYTGAAPANCAAAATGTLLAELTLPTDWLAAASSGSKSLAGTWTGAATASGNAGHFRIMDSAGTTCHQQGPVGMATANVTAWAASTAYTVGNMRRNGANVYTCTTAGTSASSGGPTGTGSGITDGTAVWAYVCPLDQDLNVDNAHLSNAQTITVSSFTITAGNA